MSKESASKGLLHYMIESHKFFVKVSQSYMQGTPRLSYYKQYPFAYLRFMKQCFKDYINYKTNKPPLN